MHVKKSLITSSQVISSVFRDSLVFSIFIEDFIRKLLEEDNVGLFVYVDDIKLLSCTFISFSLLLFINLFKLRPILENNVSAWMPHQVGDIKKFESI